MRLLSAICVTAVVIAFAVPAFAETQNIKISGDITVAHVVQNDIDLNDTFIGAAVANENDSQTFFMQKVGLNVEADLTDNVSTYVRLINEREWDSDDNGGATTDDFDILVDEAYMTLKEMLYAPLTVKIGRQNIWLGKGLIIGNAGVLVWDPDANLNATIREVSDATAFDAIRATLDYDPWTIDFIYSKIDEDNPIETEDVDLYIANVGYQFTKYDAEAEGYAIYADNKQLAAGTATANTEGDTNEILTLGLRGSFVPFDNMNVWAEGATQVGTYDDTTRQVDRQAYAGNLGCDYTFVDVRWTPLLGLEYLYMSGEAVDGVGNPEGDWEAWNPLYRGKFDNMYADFRNITKVTWYDALNGVSANQNNNGVTNEHQVAVIGGLNPMTDIKVDARYAFFWFDEKPLVNVEDEIGSEVDVKLTYDYTEDVEFTVACAFFFPGDYYPSTSLIPNTTVEYNPDCSAQQVISAVKVEF
jgi:hypothetical protein